MAVGATFPLLRRASTRVHDDEPRNVQTMKDSDRQSGWTGGKEAFGDFAPGLVHYTDAVVFDEVWERDGLSKRDRSLVTVAALTALGKTDQLRFHLGFARSNGVTDEELQEALLQLSFYSGWPNGMSATSVLREVIENEREGQR